MTVLTRLRRFWLDVHLWLGVGLLIPFAILAVTGSLLVWHDAIERWSEPQRYAVSAGPALDYGALLRAARAAVGDGFAVATLRPPAHAGEPFVAQARANGRPAPGQRPAMRSAWLDPATGRVLDVANPRESALGVMHNLHGSLMLPQNGRLVVGWMGWAMLASSLTGLWLWWPRNGQFFTGLRWRRGPRTTFNLHHSAGFWLLIPLALLAFTGAYISFPQTARAALGLFVSLPESGQRSGGPGGGPGAGGPPLSRTQLSADEAAARALSALPQARLVSLALPTKGGRGGPSWRAQLDDGAALPVTISVSDETGATKRGDPPGTEIVAARFMRRLHDGTDMGLAWQVAIFLAGWAPLGLGLTGTLMWLRRRALRRADAYAGAASTNSSPAS